MITMKTEVVVNDLSGKAITDFLLNCDDEAYHKWWSGTHIAFHIVKQYPNHVGDIVYMDEFIGKYRVRMKAIVVNIIPGKEIVWQFKALVKLPARLLLELHDQGNSVKIVHTITAGFNGFGKLLDPLFRVYLTKDFEKEMDNHAKIEFPKLKDVCCL